MQTITTTYHQATKNKGARVIATPSGEGLKVRAECSFHFGPDDRDGHREAVRRLMGKLNWTGTMFGGGSSGKMVWVFKSDSEDGNTITRSREIWQASYAEALIGGPVVRRFDSEARARQWAEQVGHGENHTFPADICKVEGE
jgi:hypothetical protein